MQYFFCCKNVVSTFLDAVIFYVGQVDIDWKKQIFAGQKDQSKKISGLQVGGTRKMVEHGKWSNTENGRTRKVVDHSSRILAKKIT